MEDDPLLTQSQAARRIGITRWAVHLAIVEGRMRALHSGPYLLITESEVLRYKEQSEHSPDMRRRNPKHRTWPVKTAARIVSHDPVTKM